MTFEIQSNLVARVSVALLACLIAAGEVAPMSESAANQPPVDCCFTAQDRQATDPAPPEQDAAPQQATSQPASDGPESSIEVSPPETSPAGVSIRGIVNVAGRLDLQKPDLTRIVVYLASDPKLDGAAAGREHVTVAQKNKSFIPNFTVVPRGTTVEFPNWDDFDHNVFSRSSAAPAFDLDRYPRGQSKSRVFEKIGVVQVFCNIHPHMRAIIFVTPNRHFTRADAAGRFELHDVPPGRYEIVAWQERCGEQRQSIEIDSNAKAPAPLLLTLQENRQSILANDPPRRDSGYGVERGLGVKRDKLNLPVVEESHPAPDAPPN